MKARTATHSVARAERQAKIGRHVLGDKWADVKRPRAVNVAALFDGSSHLGAGALYRSECGYQDAVMSTSTRIGETLAS